MVIVQRGGRVEAMGTWRNNKNPRTGCRERWDRWQCSGLAGCTQFVHRVQAISDKLFAYYWRTYPDT